jgi:hypothetical protein
VTAEGAAVGADARFVVVPPGELTVAPTGTFLSARRLRPGGPAASGELRLRNIAGTPVSVGLRGLPSAGDLDRLLRVEIESSHGLVFDGRLGGLRSWTPRFRLARSERSALRARVWLPASAVGAAAGAAVDVTVELRVAPRRG